MRLFVRRRVDVFEAMILPQGDGSGLSIVNLTDGNISKERFGSEEEAFQFLRNSDEIIGFCEVAR